MSSLFFNPLAAWSSFFGTICTASHPLHLTGPDPQQTTATIVPTPRCARSLRYPWAVLTITTCLTSPENFRPCLAIALETSTAM